MVTWIYCAVQALLGAPQGEVAEIIHHPYQHMVSLVCQAHALGARDKQHIEKYKSTTLEVIGRGIFASLVPIIASLNIDNFTIGRHDKISEGNCDDAFIQALVNNNSLARLVLNIPLSYDHTVMLCSGLLSHTRLQSMTLCVDASQKLMLAIADHVQQFSSLTRLHLQHAYGDHQIDAEIFQQLCFALSKTGLHYFALERIELNSQHIGDLADMLTTNASIHALHLISNNFNTDASCALKRFTAYSLQHLYVEDNDIISLASIPYDHLTVLQLRSCFFSNYPTEKGRALAVILAPYTNITSLDLSRNKLDAVIVGDAIMEQCPHIEHLNLAGNPTFFNNVALVTDFIDNCTGLVTLDMSRCHIMYNNARCTFFAPLIEQSTILRTLRLADTQNFSIVKDVIHDAVSGNTTLTDLDIAYAPYSHDMRSKHVLTHNKRLLDYLVLE